MDLDDLRKKAEAELDAQKRFREGRNGPDAEKLQTDCGMAWHAFRKAASSAVVLELLDELAGKG